MKKCFIGMSINKQLYFGILGIYCLFCFLCLLLLFLSSLKLFFHYNDNIKAVFNDLDTNIVSLNSENADIFAQLLFHQGNFETYLFRKYYNIMNNQIGNSLLDTLNEGIEINSSFVFHPLDNDTALCENKKCFFVFNSTKIINQNLKKILYMFIPTIEISLDTYTFAKDNLVIFNKFNFYDNESISYISFPFDKNDTNDNFDSSYPPIYFMRSIVAYIQNRASLIEELNEIKINDLSYKQFFDDNIFTLFVPKGSQIYIDPFYKNGQQTIHFASIFFTKPEKHEEKINMDNFTYASMNIGNYITFDIKPNYLAYLLINFMKVNGNFIFILVNELIFSTSKSICRLNDYTNYTYSDESINKNEYLTAEYLKINELKSGSISDCFSNSEVQDIIQSDINYNYKLKLLYDMFKYNNDRDINNNIKIKILRELSPNKYTTSFLNLKFYYSFSYYFIVFKIYNNINIFINIIDRIIYRQVSYIMLFIFSLWVCIFIYILIKLFLIADRISSPIRKLIKNISLSQSNFIKDELKLEQIYYKEDKDINDLFQLCQKLILGGFKKTINNQKKNKLNVYNNISKVKTNNMAINENQIIIERNQKYNEIFEKREDKQKINNIFKQDIYYKYKSKDFDNKIKNYESKKLKKLSVEKREEFEKIKNKDNEYKMFYYINKEIEGYLPYNNLYKIYYEKFSNKSNKKKRNNYIAFHQ